MPEIEEKIAEILCNKIDGKEKIRGSSYEELKRTIEDSEYDGCFSLKHCNSTVNYYREKAIELLASEIEPSVTLKDIIDYHYDKDKYSVVCPICGTFRYYTEKEKELFNKGLINSEKIKPYCKCFKCNEELNINNFIAITSREEGHKNLCGDCYVQLSKEKGNATRPEEENT